MGDVIYTPAFDQRRDASGAARQRIQRRRSNAAADRAFWKGGPAIDPDDLSMGHADHEAADTSPSEYIAPDHDCA